jgi:hypothetical protein
VTKGEYATRKFDDESTIGEAREWLRDAFEEGAYCPCCTRLVKLYKRKLSSGMARTLVIVYRAFQSDSALCWLDVTEYLKQRKVIAANSNTALLRHWGLLEQAPADRFADTKSTGLYRITGLGIQFARGEVDVVRHIYMYNDQVLKRKDPDLSRTTIREALGEKFNYDELMGASPDGSSGESGI